MDEFAAFHEALIILVAAAIVIPLFYRLRLSPVVGFILVGIAVGPFGLGALAGRFHFLEYVTIDDTDSLDHMAELGVVMLMFMIGLELSFERLKSLQRLVFGLGGLQVLLSAAAIAGCAFWLGQNLAASILLGFALAMSSTAIAGQILTNESRLETPEGEGAFAILLFQDLAVVPVLFVIGMLGGDTAGGAAFAWALGQAVLAVAVLLGLGRLALRPLFRSVARTHSPELFMAACLLVVIGTGLATAAAGLSMAMGALIAGLLLAETEYRHQIELTIEPFKGLLVGVFLISVGMGLNLGLLFANPLPVLGAAVGLIVVKLAIIAVTARVFGLPWTAGLQAGLLLGPGGEFGFVMMAAALASSLVSPAISAFALLLAALTMSCIPFLSSAGKSLARRLAKAPEGLAPPPQPVGSTDVILAGYGRVGETVARMLEVHKIPYIAIDNDIDRVVQQRRLGRNVHWGDITRPAMLHHLQLATARALVVTMSDHDAAEHLIAAAREARSDLLIIARARDADHAAHLYAIGASDAVPETIEASLQLSEAVLVDVGIPMGPVIASIHEHRAQLQTLMRKGEPPRRLGRRLRDIEKS